MLEEVCYTWISRTKCLPEIAEKKKMKVAYILIPLNTLLQAIYKARFLTEYRTL